MLWYYCYAFRTGCMLALTFNLSPDKPDKFAHKPKMIFGL
jgi:hypothetical protein